MFSKLKFIVLVLAAAVCTLSAAVEEPFNQYDADAFNLTQRQEQPWLGAQWMSLNVSAGTSLWLTSYVQSWYEPVPDLASRFDMSAGKYGYILKSDLTSSDQNHSDYADKVIWSSGETKDITYTNSNGPQTQTTTGYLLDKFFQDSEIFFVMTALPEEGGETVDSFQYVGDYLHGTSLVSRVAGTTDLAGNVRMNFGINSTDTEFVAVWDTPDFNNAPTGQPLPGAMASTVIGLGVVFLGKKLRKHKADKQ